MKKLQNESSLDRTVRIILGLFLLVVALNIIGALKVIFLLISAILIITGLVGFCPLYKILKINTLKK